MAATSVLSLLQGATIRFIFENVGIYVFAATTRHVAALRGLGGMFGSSPLPFLPAQVRK